MYLAVYSALSMPRQCGSRSRYLDVTTGAVKGKARPIHALLGPHGIKESCRGISHTAYRCSATSFVHPICCNQPYGVVRFPTLKSSTSTLAIVAAATVIPARPLGKVASVAVSTSTLLR